MAEDRFEKLLEAAGEADKAELELAHHGKVRAMRAYNESPGRRTRDDYQAACQFYDEVVERLWGKYFPAAGPDDGAERFKNRKQAFDWLKAEGYKVSQGKFYKDCERGFPAVHRDGTVSRWQVLEYARRLDGGRNGTADPAVLADRDERKKQLEIRRLELAVAREEREARREDERWILKEDAWAQVAALVGVILDALRHHFYVAAPRIVVAASGAAGREPEVYETCEEVIAAAFNEARATGRIESMFEKEEDEEDA